MHPMPPRHADSEILGIQHLVIRAIDHPLDRRRPHISHASSDETRRAQVKFADRIRARARAMVAMDDCVLASLDRHDSTAL
jgi:hypothetical protein